MKRLLSGVLLLLVAMLTSCSDGNKVVNKLDNEYHVYYLDSKSSGIVSETYVPLGSTKEQLVTELLDALQTDPSNMVYKRALPEDVTIRDYSFVNDQLILNFDTKYSELKEIPEVLCRATIVKTLCQIPGIDFVMFNVNGQPLIDTNGVQMGLMTAEFFIENTGAEIGRAHV